MIELFEFCFIDCVSPHISAENPESFRHLELILVNQNE
jgi:hypothetical protein